MPLFAIFDNEVGILQWIGTGGIARHVTTDFRDAVHSFGKDRGRDEFPAEFHAYEITKAERVALEKWAWEGSPADEFPLAKDRMIDA